MKVYVYFDESGAKGYSDNREKHPGEFGLLAAVLLSEKCYASIKKEFDEVAQKYLPETGKLHITELKSERQKSLRADIFEIIKKKEIPCFWCANYVEGLYDCFDAQRKLHSNLNLPKSERYKTGSPREPKELMLLRLFLGLFSKIIAFLEENYPSECLEILIFTDNLDDALIKKMKNKAKDFLEIEQKQISDYTAYDSHENRLVNRSIVVQAHIPDCYKFAIIVQKIDLIKESDHANGLILAADVLANSLHYHLKPFSERQERLNNFKVVEGHPLTQNFNVFDNWGEGDFIDDLLLRHPNKKE